MSLSDTRERTNDAMMGLDVYCGQVEDGLHAESNDAGALILAIGLSARVVAYALRELAEVTATVGVAK